MGRSSQESQDSKFKAGAEGEPLDDTSPIASSGDLDIVKEGAAFWETARSDAEAQRGEDETHPSKHDVGHQAEKAVKTEGSSAREDTSKVTTSVVFADDKPSGGPAPSLADLARKRREEMAEGAHDDNAKASRSTTEDDTVRSEPDEDIDPDDTDPGGVETSPTSEEVASAPPEPTIQVVSRSPDVAFIDGSSIHIPGSHWTSGETVVVQGKTFQLKRKVDKYPISPKLAAFTGGGFLLGLLFMFMFTSGSPVPRGNIFGIVREAGSGNLLPGVTVALEDQGTTSESDPSGMFSFHDLEEGIYTLIATDPIYGKQRRTVTVADGAASVLLDLEREIIAVVEPPKPAPVKPKPKPKPTSSSSSGSTSGRGKLAVTASVPNAKIFLDGKMLGVGNAVYSGIRSGKRTIRVEYEGFEPWTQSVTIKGGETNRIEPRLRAAEPAKPEQLSPDQYANAGLKFLQSRQYKLAIEQFNMAIQGSQRAQYYAWRADAHAGLKQLQPAEGDYLAALALYQQANEGKKLADMLERAVLVVPGSSQLRMSYADYLYSKRQLRDAERSYRKALDLGADRSRSYIGIGLAQYAGGSFDQAEDSWTMADDASGNVDPHIAGYLALVNARLQYRASCRNSVRRLREFPDVLQQFRAHPDWDRVRRLTGEG
jgi:Tfp pilus assembly protein PilF